MFRIIKRRTPRLVKLRTSRVLAAVAVLFLLSGSPALGQDAAADIADGQYIYIRNPISTDVVNRVKTQSRRFLDRAQHQGAKIVFDFNPQGYPSSTSDYGSCRELAAFILGIQDVTTIAFVHADH